jgi:O-acetyl-ADP-ribose deacetylase (regulator of RNase III)
MRVKVIQGDITEVEADVIVNAANSYLQHGGGVALAISRKGGPTIQRESDEYVRKHGPIPTGGVAVTSAGKLRARYVIHAVGPKFGMEGDEKLEEAVRNSILKAVELGARSVALPAISTGIYGYPYSRCAQITAKVLRELWHLDLEVILCLYSQEAFTTFREVLERELNRMSY